MEISTRSEASSFRLAVTPQPNSTGARIRLHARILRWYISRDSRGKTPCGGGFESHLIEGGGHGRVDVNWSAAVSLTGSRRKEEAMMRERRRGSPPTALGKTRRAAPSLRGARSKEAQRNGSMECRLITTVNLPPPAPEASAKRRR